MPRTYLVTGSASGIGKAILLRLRDEGYRVIGVDLKDADICVDISLPEGRKELTERAGELTDGRLDAVIACAGVREFSPRTVQVNYFGTVATLEGLRPMLALGENPRAVAVSSMACIHDYDSGVVKSCLAEDEGAAVAASEKVPNEDVTLLYGSSKVALSKWIRRTAISQEWAGYGIPLNAIAPGIVVTPMAQPLFDDPAAREVLEHCPMPLSGFAEPEQVASLLAWLTSPENTHLTGQILFIDGGAEVSWQPDALTWASAGEPRHRTFLRRLHGRLGRIGQLATPSKRR
nr:SDR family oxidoreductase [Streptomyces oceani]